MCAITHACTRGRQVAPGCLPVCSSLQECLRMTVAVPRLWGVPPELDRLEHGIKSGGGIIDKVCREWHIH